MYQYEDDDDNDCEYYFGCSGSNDHPKIFPTSLIRSQHYSI